MVSDIPLVLCGISQHSRFRSVWGNEGSKWTYAGMLILASLLPEEVVQNWLPSMGGCQGRLLRGKTALGKGIQGSAASLPMRALGSQAHSSFFPDSLLCERKLVSLGLESSYGRTADGAMVLKMQAEIETLARMQGGNSIPKSGWVQEVS